MTDNENKALLDQFGRTAYLLAGSPATVRYNEELRAIGNGFRKLVYGQDIGDAARQAIASLRADHESEIIALGFAFGRIIAFNFDPTENIEALFLPDGKRRWETVRDSECQHQHQQSGGPGEGEIVGPQDRNGIRPLL